MPASERRPRLLLVIEEASIGGGPRHVLDLARGLREEYDVSVACEPSGYLVDELASLGIHHHGLKIANRPSWRMVREMTAIMRKCRPDIVHTHGGTAGVYGRIAARWVGGTVVVHTYHGIHYLNFGKSFRSLVYRSLDRLLLTSTDRIICVSEGDYRQALEAKVGLAGFTSVVPNGIDIARFRNIGGLSTLRGGAVVGTIGRLHVQKGHSYLLRGWGNVLRQCPEVRLRIVGDGPLRREIQELADGLGISETVEFVGARVDTADQLKEMALFVLPSLWEGMPLVMLEAMAAGCPIVASAISGVSEVLVDGSTALLVPPRSPERLAEAIVRLLKNPQLAGELAGHALALVEARYNVSLMVSRTSEIYRSLLEAPR